MATRKAHIIVKGKVKNPLYKLLGRAKAALYGLDHIDFTEHPSGHVEVFVQGKKEKLWDIIEWTKKGNVFLKVSEVTFRFKDVTG
ncbi:MAG: hypothetical protein ACD_22C00023G0002 [uncultured bacterium]|nr:MAG: hypothetical protein ACD_22C00023G0002 [uncultured bacterium]